MITRIEINPGKRYVASSSLPEITFVWLGYDEMNRVVIQSYPLEGFPTWNECMDSVDQVKALDADNHIVVKQNFERTKTSNR